MKRVIAVLLIVMLLFILTACSDYKDYSEQLEREVHIEEKLDYEGCGVVVTDVNFSSLFSNIFLLSVALINFTVRQTKIISSDESCLTSVTTTPQPS